jgi:hypothetical protein
MPQCGYPSEHDNFSGGSGRPAYPSEEVTRMYIGIGTLIVVIVLLIILL